VGVRRLRPSSSPGRSRGRNWTGSLHTPPPSSISPHQVVTASSPSSPTPSPPGPFGRSEHRVPPVSCGARIQVMVARRALSARRHVHARHRAAALMLVRPGFEPGWERSFLAGATAFVDARVARCSTLCPSVRRHERRHAGCARTPACVAAGAGPLAVSRARLGSMHMDSPYTAHARSLVARSSLGSPKTGARRRAFFLTNQERACAHPNSTSPAPVTPGRAALLFPQA
jgi:hypothetical protein